MPPRRSTKKSKAKAPRVSKKRARSPEKGDKSAQGGQTINIENDEQPAKRVKSGTKDDVASSSEEDGVKVKDMSTASKATEDKSAEATPITELSGKFDLYAMELPFLSKVYQPAGASSLQPENLYNTILTYQAKNDRTAKIDIPEGPAVGKDGTFRSGIFCDPMEEMPFDISISNVEVVDKLDELSGEHVIGRPGDAWEGPGFRGWMEIEDEGCGISSSSGMIYMRPLWKKKADDTVLELFEGSFSFEVEYSSLYSRKGHGEGQDATVPFWAVRAKK